MDDPPPRTLSHLPLTSACLCVVVKSGGRPPSSHPITSPLTSPCPPCHPCLSRNVSIIVLKSAVASTIGDTVAQTWLSVTGSTTIDVYSNTISLISPSHAVQVGPQIVRFSLDMNTGKVIMVFSKNMNLLPGTSGGRFDPSKIGFYSLLTGRYYYLAALSSNGRNTTLTNHTLVSPVSGIPYKSPHTNRPIQIVPYKSSHTNQPIQSNPYKSQPKSNES